ncbi:MAG: RsmE family RNA methyltransferase [Planctomycetota bacterium]
MEDARELRRFLALGPCRAGETVTLAPEQSRHMVVVLRAEPGDRVRLFTGEGAEYLGRVVEADPKAARVRVVERLETGGGVGTVVTLGFAPAPQNRSDTIVEKATELGADRLRPLLCRRVQRRQARSAARRLERWERLAQEAARQSQRAEVPRVLPPVAFEQFVDDAEGLRLIAVTGESTPLWDRLQGLEEPPPVAVLAVGPAGGFTQREADRAAEAGFLPVALGPHVLRVETAAVALLTALVLRLDALPAAGQQ